VCVTRQHTCSVAAGTRVQNFGNTTSPPTCVGIEPCNVSTSFVSVAATPFSDPVCLFTAGNCTPASEYEAAFPTIQRDRTCAQLSAVCNLTVAEIIELSAVLEARPAVDYFEAATPTPTTDRICSPATVCNFDEVMAVALTASTDRTCGPVGDSAPIPGPPVTPPSGTPALVWGCASTLVAAAIYANFNFYGT